MTLNILAAAPLDSAARHYHSRSRFMDAAGPR